MMIITERIENGDGTYSLTDYHAADGSPTDKAHAHSAEITDYDAAGNVLLRTYGTFVKSKSRLHKFIKGAV